MQYKDFVTSFIRTWNFTRSETLEILNSLSDEQLQFKPEGEKWQPLYFQFGCLASTQMVYARAITTGAMDYSLFRSEEFPKRDQFKTKKELLKYLERADKEWIEAIRARRHDEEFKIKWPGFNSSLPTHISSLNGHERLHHGQLISYLTMAGFEIPKNFKSNWAL